ncbi:MAG: radical SAM protein [Spirochaetaceae bacterium]|nr:radical SAM protein [Spirochaetaceae bacterium]
MSVAFQTLGCKLNQGETESIAAAFINAGFSIAADASKAELLIINSCAVTSKAEQKGRGLIRAALRQDPSRCVIVTGCSTELNRKSLEALDDSVQCRTPDKRRLFVVPSSPQNLIFDMPPRIVRRLARPQENRNVKAALQDALARICAETGGDGGGKSDGGDDINTDSTDSGTFRFETSGGIYRSRGFLKIQDGCDNSCAYCIVRIARGKARSLPAKEVLERLRIMEAMGMAEAVLTGVNICRWNGGADGIKTGLPGLLQVLIAGTTEIGIRLSSLEPAVFTEDFFETLRDPRIKPHFHLSIQSGSLEILKKMRRFYDAGTALRVIRRLRGIKDDPFIACDIITGFPGETDRHFSETLSFCEAAEFAQIHAFPFSRRPGTAAWDYTPRIPEREAEKRVHILKTLAAKNRRLYIERWIGREIEGVCMSDAVMAAKSGVIEILADNYLRICAADCSGFDARKGQRALCKITGFFDGGGRADAYGRLI